MLERLLRLLAEGGLYSYEDLMDRLSVTRPMLEMMLQELARLGYLRLVDGECAGQCSICPLRHCALPDRGRLWTLTDKGARAGAQPSS